MTIARPCTEVVSRIATKLLGHHLWLKFFIAAMPDPQRFASIKIHKTLTISPLNHHFRAHQHPMNGHSGPSQAGRLRHFRERLPGRRGPRAASGGPPGSALGAEGRPWQAALQRWAEEHGGGHASPQRELAGPGGLAQGWV